MEFPQLTQLVIYLFFKYFCTLASVAITYFPPEVISDVGLVKLLANRRLCSIHSWMKEIRMVPMYYVTLDFLRNNDLILTRYKVKINITTSTKRTLMVCTIFIFSCYYSFRLLMFLDQF